MEGEDWARAGAFISTNKTYSQNWIGTPGYDVLVEFNVAENTIHDLAEIGVKDASSLVSTNGFDDLPSVSGSNWVSSGKAYFKKEQRPGTTIISMNIGLQSTVSKAVFNENLVDFQLVQ